jgi:hypothetical protein
VRQLEALVRHVKRALQLPGIDLDDVALGWIYYFFIKKYNI